MGLLVEGIGEDWIILRRQGGRPELITFKSLDEMRKVMSRALLKASQSPQEKPEKATRSPFVLPQVRPASPPPIPPPKLPKPKRPKYRPLPPDADCQSCGACCAPKDQRKDSHPALEKEDVQLLPAIMRKSLVVRDGGHPYIRTKKGPDGKTVCAAFKGSIGGRCKCGIYEKRPMVCRIFEKGSEECLAARAAFGV